MTWRRMTVPIDIPVRTVLLVTPGEQPDVQYDHDRAFVKDRLIDLSHAARKLFPCRVANVGISDSTRQRAPRCVCRSGRIVSQRTEADQLRKQMQEKYGCRWSSPGDQYWRSGIGATLESADPAKQVETVAGLRSVVVDSDQ